MPPLIPERARRQRRRRRCNPSSNQAALIKLAREEALWLFNSDDPGAIQQALPQRPDVVVTDGAAPVRWQLGD